MNKTTSCRISNELRVEIKSIKRKLKTKIGVELSDVEITKLIARKIKKIPIRLRKVGRGYKLL